MSSIFYRIIILFISFIIITSCNPDTCYLADCSDQEKMKISLLNCFGDHFPEEYRCIDSLDWDFEETDSTYDVGIYIKKEILIRVGILDEFGHHFIILKNNRKAIHYRIDYRTGKGII